MTEQEQRIAIAEACGYTGINVQSPLWFSEDKGRFVPDYPNDLNAMRDATLTLNEEQQNQFAAELMRVLIINSDQIPEPCVLFEFCNATAAQRAEAFLRTIGKWRD